MKQQEDVNMHTLLHKK
uniref:Uncharacterized protein n=1 Tax=Anguilla anguilla TaxID=7936 RepID=A0A0E9TV12_ANGAN